MSGAVGLGVAAAVVGTELVPGDVAVAGDTIAAVGLHPAGARGLAVPGYVDVQVNGFAGVDFAHIGAGDLARAGEAMAATGVTAFQPTLITMAEAAYVEALSRLADAGGDTGGPRLLGVHLEGPFLSPERRGAHDAGLMVEPDLGLCDRLLAAGPVSHVTIAPELPGALEVIRHLVERGVTVSIGHSDATAEVAHRAFDAGARAVTHLFNAQRPFRHRDPGLGFAALARPGVTVTIIVDGIHLAGDTVRVVTGAAPGRVALITDAVSAAGLPDGGYTLAGRAIEVAEGAVRLEDGTLAGSVLTMGLAVRNLVDLGVPLTEAVGAATRVPAALAGRPELGTLAPGTPADVVVLDDRLQVTRTLVAGTEVHSA